MAWSEIDTDAGIWVLPAARSKNAVEHQIPITGMALDLVRSIPRRLGRDHLFSGGEAGFTGWSTNKAALDARITAARGDAGPMPDWTLHDLRRTTATKMGDLHILPHTIEVVLNHASGFRRGVGRVYNLSAYSAEKTAALATWGDHVRTLIEGGQRKIIPLHKRR